MAEVIMNSWSIVTSILYTQANKEVDVRSDKEPEWTGDETAGETS